MIIFYFLTVIENAPLYGDGKYFEKWIEVTVPLLFIIFFIPGLIYGILDKRIKNKIPSTKGKL